MKLKPKRGLLNENYNDFQKKYQSLKQAEGTPSYHNREYKSQVRYISNQSDEIDLAG